jgi:hypothetical protein
MATGNVPSSLAGLPDFSLNGDIYNSVLSATTSLVQDDSITQANLAKLSAKAAQIEAFCTSIAKITPDNNGTPVQRRTAGTPVTALPTRTSSHIHTQPPLTPAKAARTPSNMHTPPNRE